MANDASSKSNPNCDSTENATLSNAGDQQKVPPLRIVLNSSTSNQKSLSTTSTVQQASTKSEKNSEARQEGSLKTTGRVRIKLGTNRQQGAKVTNDNATNDSANKSENQKAKEKSNDKQEDNLNEDSASSFNHLRRITRRSHRSIQSIGNEDEESISSMTSIDENISNTNNNHLSSDTTHDIDQSNSSSALTSTSAAVVATTSGATNGSSNVDTPRRHKRRKVESSESQSLEYDSLLGTQNYKLPNQNSFELFKNIRKQVDKKLRSLINVHPRSPHGLRDYMLARGTYLLDGNKLGNGTNLFLNEHGGLNPAPIGKFHLVRPNRTNYSVPNRAKVPVGLPVKSPLYELFIEQERERYRMQIQHIKEREKLTLAVEQEFMRAYSQAALEDANQTEPFSVCTMLKHQEIYNYIDSDGVMILSREDAQQDQVNQTDGVRTRRRQHGQISPAPARKSSNSDESSAAAAEVLRKDSEASTNDKKSDSSQIKTPVCSAKEDAESNKAQDVTQNELEATHLAGETLKSCSSEKQLSKSKETTDGSNIDVLADNLTKSDKSETDDKTASITDCITLESESEKQVETESKDEPGEAQEIKKEQVEIQTVEEPIQNSTSDDANKTTTTTKPNEEDHCDKSSNPKSSDSSSNVTDEEKKAVNKEAFLIKLQEIDDKWDKIRREMLIRHRNEAESLHAIQKLEWEWKTKEIGVCDVRATPTIDISLVPKLDILSQDY